ncbi:MAG: hypothetical protein COA84_03350 [Robiginitomaculum sp.]|nr:MAG: hypothetical protein COA84_03350 [Robiginitomaculum sp.]
MFGSKLHRDNGWLSQLSLVIMVAFATVVFTAGPADAQSRRKEKEQKTEGRVLSTSVGEAIIEAQEALSAEPPDNNTSIAVLTKLLTKDKLSPYERAITYQIRGQAQYGAGNMRGTISDWESAIATGALNQGEIDSLTPNIGQLYIAEGEYVKGATILENWLRNGGKANDRIHLMIAQSWLQADAYRKALPHAEAAFRMANPKKKKHFDILNYVYHEMKMPAKQAKLLEQEVSIWPDDKKIWRAIASLKQMANKSREAFEVNKIMYLNGMLQKERELLALAQYYSYYEVPYRGASILEREMNAGRVSKKKKNLELLANMWRQAREYERAIPILTAAADIAGDGGLYEKLGEAYYSEEQYDKAEKAFRKAIEKGIKKPGNAYILIANSLYERDRPRDAIKEFKKAVQYPYARKIATGWIRFINGEFQVARKQAEFKYKVKLDECKNQVDRKRRMGAEFLEGVGEISKECVIILAKEEAKEKAKKAARKS